MELQTINQVSKAYGISTRMLRYYEQAGLIYSLRKDDYAYRVYDEATLVRLQQIIVLRKLRIPVKQIGIILNSPYATEAVEVIIQHIKQLDSEMTAISTIKEILVRLAGELQRRDNIHMNIDLLTDSSILSIVETLSPSKNLIKEPMTMADLNQASEQLNALTDKDVRIVYLPPSTVLSFHAVGHDEQGRGPEDQHDPLLDDFERELAKIKPDFRHYGFDHDVDGIHGYERLVTIPDDMEVPPPFTKKQFPGGMFAASKLLPWEGGWTLLEEWVAGSEKYDFATRGSWENWLEEHTTAAQIITGAEMYIDLLMPIKLRKEKRKPVKLGYIEDSETKCGFKASVIKTKGFTIAGYTRIASGDVPRETLAAELLADGRLERLKAALKPGAPLMLFESYDGECGQVGNELGVWSYRRTVCINLNDVIDQDAFLTDEMFVQKLPPKHWIEFEFPKSLRNKFSEGPNAHDHVQKLDWRFSGAGHFDIYYDSDMFFNEDNSGLMRFWMPVVPLN